MLSFRIFDDAGFQKKLRAVPEDDEGIDIEFLRREIRKSEEKARLDKNDQPVSASKSTSPTRRNKLQLPHHNRLFRLFVNIDWIRVLLFFGLAVTMQILIR